MSTQTQIPEVLWAQRSSKTDAEKNFVYLTITVPDVPKDQLKLDLTSTKLNFTGHSESLKRTYHVELEFYAEIDEKASKVNHTGKNVELVLRKKELKEEYWPRLLKEAKKVHFLKTDFDKWVDEDEQEDAPDDDMMANMGGMGGMPGMGGDMASMMGGMGGMGGMGDFGGIDFSKLGAGAGMPGMGDEDEGEDDDDDDMPGLEGEEEAKGEEAKAEEESKGEAEAETSKAKIEEVA